MAGKTHRGDRHRGTFLGTWLNEEEMQKIEVIKRKTGLKSRSSIVKWALARAYQFAKDERGG